MPIPATTADAKLIMQAPPPEQVLPALLLTAITCAAEAFVFCAFAPCSGQSLAHSSLDNGHSDLLTALASMEDVVPAAALSSPQAITCVAKSEAENVRANNTFFISRRLTFGKTTTKISKSLHYIYT